MVDETPPSEREQTDTSLRTERERTDRALAERQAAVDDDADTTIQRAREAADAVLAAARELADEQLEHPDTATAPQAVIAAQRSVEDEALRDERAAADEVLREERRASARSLSRLLPLEREKTDRYLLTERARADDAVAHRDDFLSIVSHDLRNLLGGIVMSAELLARLAAADDQAVTAAARIQRYAARMNRLVGDLVDVASIDAGKLAVTPASGDATALMAEAVDMFQAAATAKGVALTAELDGPLLAAFDHERALQVLANLITNAIKFTAPGGSVRLRGQPVGDALQISVHDSGAGIPAGMLEAIFDRFWQVGNNDRRGLGLGLYISRCIVEAHGGEIWAESTLGVGTTLCFTLPGAYASSAGPRAPGSAP